MSFWTGICPEIKTNNLLVGPHETKKLVYSNETINRVKKKSIEWERIFVTIHWKKINIHNIKRTEQKNKETNNNKTKAESSKVKETHPN